MNAPPETSVRHLLRRSTRSAHQRLEDRLDRILWPITPGTYRWLIETWYGYLAASEPAVLPWLQHCAALEPEKRRHLTRLANDLISLGVPESQHAKLRHCPAVPQPGSLAAALGCAYVVEGSSLGGQIIRQRVGSALGLAPNHGLSFFSGYDRDTGSMWRSFCLELERHCPDAASRAEAEAFAVASFQAFDHWFALQSLQLEGQT